MNPRLQVIKYLIGDWLSASAAWTVLFIFRKRVLETDKFGYDIGLSFDENYYYGLLCIPLFWITLFLLMGHYKRIYRRYRTKEISQVFTVSAIGVMFLFLAILLDDQIVSYRNYYQSLIVLFGCQFGFTVFVRMIWTTKTVHRVHRREIGFNTIIVGGNDRALAMYEEVQVMKKSPGFRFVGFVKVNGKDTLLAKHMSNLGTYKDLPELIERKEIEEVVIAIESSDHDYLENIFNLLEGTGVNIKVIPDMYDILTGSVKMTSIFGAPLIEINREIMPQWQFSAKRILDIGLSVLALTILLPFYLILAIGVKLTSKGPVFYKQTRIGRYGRPFQIYKFRTMQTDAEKKGPQLSNASDSRVTPFGRFLRKYRLDELPQFWNVLKGDMAIVGPRPERQFFIDKIMKKAPHYAHLAKVRPGITSWGMVKYGYAENVDQMIHRLKYDILYIENMSLAVDFKILIYTVMIVLKGSGK